MDDSEGILLRVRLERRDRGRRRARTQFARRGAMTRPGLNVARIAPRGWGVIGIEPLGSQRFLSLGNPKLEGSGLDAARVAQPSRPH